MKKKLTYFLQHKKVRNIFAHFIQICLIKYYEKSTIKDNNGSLNGQTNNATKYINCQQYISLFKVKTNYI